MPSFLLKRSIEPSSFIASISRKRLIEFLTVLKLVNIPPNHGDQRMVDLHVLLLLQLFLALHVLYQQKEYGHF